MEYKARTRFFHFNSFFKITYTTNDLKRLDLGSSRGLSFTVWDEAVVILKH